MAFEVKVRGFERCVAGFGLVLGCAAVFLPAACTPAARRPPVGLASPADAPAAAPEAAVEMVRPVDAPASASERASLACVVPADPELEKETPWSKALGQRLERVLPKLGRCSASLPAGEEARVTLRLVYAKDGTPLSRHVVDSTPNACPLVQCLDQELAEVRSPELLIDRGSYDLALVLERDVAPRREGEPKDPLASEGATEASCIDPRVGLFSRANVLEILRSTDDRLQACHDQAIVRHHDAAGRVEFELVVGHEGEVVSAEAREATLMDCEAIECMLDQFRALRFPAPVGRGVRLIYPVNYRIEQPPVSFR